MEAFYLGTCTMVTVQFQKTSTGVAHPLKITRSTKGIGSFFAKNTNTSKMALHGAMNFWHFIHKDGCAQPLTFPIFCQSFAH
jgi:hypothetical protein